MKKSLELNIVLDTKNFWGSTPFHMACCYGRICILEMMIINAKTLKIDFMIKNKDGETGYELAKRNHSYGVVKLIEAKLPCESFQSRRGTSRRKRWYKP